MLERKMVAAADLLDIILYLWLVRLRATLTAAGGGEVWVVGDRSLDDVLVKHRRLGTLSERGVALIRKLAPEFEVTIWLKVDPEVVVRRDGDFGLAHHEDLYAAYEKATGLFGWREVPELGRDPAGVLAAVARELGIAVPDDPATEKPLSGDVV